MFEQNLENEILTKNNKKITFQELWETDLDFLYREYDLISDTDEDDQFITDENWLIF